MFIIDALEEYEIYKAFKDRNISKDSILNEQLKFQSNALYDTVLNIVARDGGEMR